VPGGISTEHLVEKRLGKRNINNEQDDTLVKKSESAWMPDSEYTVSFVQHHPRDNRQQYLQGELQDGLCRRKAAFVTNKKNAHP